MLDLEGMKWLVVKQVKQFQEVLFVIQQYTASTLPSKLDDDIRHSLNKVMSLRVEHPTVSLLLETQK